MFRYQKWVLTLGIMAVTPGIAMAGPFSLFKRKPENPSAGSAERGKTANRPTNQQVAEQIARELRARQFDRHNLEIEFQKGIATLSGEVSTPAQKTAISRVVSSVPGVDRVNNRISVKAPNSPSGVIQQAGAFGPQGGIRQVSAEATPYLDAATTAEGNQQTAEAIGRALSEAGLSGYDIEIRYQNGVASLNGNVSSPEQWQQASRLVAQVPGVRAVDNRMSVAGQQPPGGPMIAPTGYQPPPPAAGGPGPMPYGHPGQGAAHTVYNMPNMPDHAWPAMATYPNSAQISYPTQYSASAWPYIGPFYPYPQVPLGWRKAQLEWDDGQWVLKFKPKTDKWFWFLNPENW